MFCARCGQQVSDATVICPLCGRESTIRLQPSPATAAAPAPALYPVYSPGDSSELLGVRGWLLVFCVWLTVLTPLANLRGLGMHGRWAVFYSILILSALVVGIQVWRRDRHALTWVKAYFLGLGSWELIRIVYVVVVDRRWFDVQMLLRVRTLLWLAIWAAYFWKSKRVRATFGQNLFEQNPW